MKIWIPKTSQELCPPIYKKNRWLLPCALQRKKSLLQLNSSHLGSMLTENLSFQVSSQHQLRSKTQIRGLRAGQLQKKEVVVVRASERVGHPDCIKTAARAQPVENKKRHLCMLRHIVSSQLALNRELRIQKRQQALKIQIRLRRGHFRSGTLIHLIKSISTWTSTSERRESNKQLRSAVKSKKSVKMLRALNLLEFQSRKAMMRSVRLKLNSRTSMATPRRLFKFSKISTSSLRVHRSPTTLHLVTVYPMSRRKVL